MAASEKRLDLARRFAGADPEDDAVLEACLSSAVSYFKGAGVNANLEDPQYDYQVCNLAAWYYDNRGTADANAAIPMYIVTSVHQLRAKGAM